MKNEIIQRITQNISQEFKDFTGLYFFGSRTKQNYLNNSDYDIVLVFDNLDYRKELKIAGIISKLEYENNVFIDYKTFTTSGNKSIENIRNNINPVFINEAIDNGIYFGRI
jgi:DNA polymerase sigma